MKEEDEAKGFERGESDYVLLTDEDLETVALESVRTIDIERFVPRDSIEWVYLESPFFLTASDKIGDDAFAVIPDAISCVTISIVRSSEAKSRMTFKTSPISSGSKPVGGTKSRSD